MEAICVTRDHSDTQRLRTPQLGGQQSRVLFRDQRVSIRGPDREARAPRGNATQVVGGRQSAFVGELVGGAISRVEPAHLAESHRLEELHELVRAARVHHGANLEARELRTCERVRLVALETQAMETRGCNWRRVLY